MSRRVAIRKELAGTAGGAVAGRAAGMALGSVVPGIGTAIGGAIGGALGAKLGDKATDKAGEMSGNQSFTDKVKSRGGKAAEAGAAYAQAQQASQQRMEERGMQMAEKAKQGSQITTGEPMDMSWQLLKDMYFTSPFQTPEYAQSRQRIIDTAIENMQNKNLFQPQQHGKIRAGFVEDIPQAGRDGLSNIRQTGGKTEYRDTGGGWTAPRFNPDYMYDQEHSDPKNFPGMYNIPSHVLMNALAQHTDFSVLPTFQEEKGGSDRMRGAVKNLFESKQSGFGSKTTQEFQPLLQEMGLPALTTVLAQHHDVPFEQRINPTDIMQRNLGRDESLLAANRQRHKETRQKRAEIEARRAEERRLEEQRVEDERKAGVAEKIQQKGADQKASTQAKRQKTMQENKARQAEEEEKKNTLNEAVQSFDEEAGEEWINSEEGEEYKNRWSNMFNMWFYNGKQIPHKKDLLNLLGDDFRQYVRARKAGIAMGHPLLKSLPMDLAWRMLKGELQLPHQITDALRNDLTTLDRAHKMTDTNDGTLIEGIHPDMEHVVKLLAEKHMGDLTPTKQRPVMPLFHGPHH